MYSITILACAGIVAAVVFFASAGSLRAADTGAPAKTPVTKRQVKSMSQEKIREMLGKVEKKAAPEPKMGAMCYDMAAPPARVEYVCPQCGQKTLYTKEAAWEVRWTVDACRRQFQSLKSSTDLSVTLDESSYCSHCRPEAKTHEMALIVTYADGAACTNSPITDIDLRALQGFLKGDLEFKTLNDGTQPLKSHTDRLRILLGISGEAGGKGK